MTTDRTSAPQTSAWRSTGTQRHYQCDRVRMSFMDRSDEHEPRFIMVIEGPAGFLRARTCSQDPYDPGFSYWTPHVGAEATTAEFTEAVMALVLDEPGFLPWDQIAALNQPQPEARALKTIEAEIPRADDLSPVALAYLGDGLAGLGDWMRRTREREARAAEDAAHDKISRKLFDRLPPGTAFFTFAPAFQLAILRDERGRRTKRILEDVTPNSPNGAWNQRIDLDRDARFRFRLLTTENSAELPRDRVSAHEVMHLLAGNCGLGEEFAAIA